MRSPELLTYRMYGLVNYQLAKTIHAGIQFGHAVVEYGQYVKRHPTREKIYNKWADNDKTFIILDGGTTNENQGRLGSMQKNHILLNENSVMCVPFREPDLNDTLTAIAFLVSEEVFDREKYPDFVHEGFPSSTEEEDDMRYQEWLKGIGGSSNEFLRSFLPQFKLA